MNPLQSLQEVLRKQTVADSDGKQTLGVRIWKSGQLIPATLQWKPKIVSELT